MLTSIRPRVTRSASLGTDLPAWQPAAARTNPVTAKEGTKKEAKQEPRMESLLCPVMMISRPRRWAAASPEAARDHHAWTAPSALLNGPSANAKKT
jgi:hypothetical protein